MSSEARISKDSTTDSASQVRSLYQAFLDGWNNHNASEIANLFAEDGNVVGFDGSQMNGREEIGQVLGQIFADHVTAEYIGIVREVVLLSSQIAVLRAVAGMVPPGQSKIDAAVNSIQSLVAQRMEGEWRIALLQTTPAAFHGRPDLSEHLTAELQRELDASR